MTRTLPTESALLRGAEGDIEVLIDAPESVRGVALVCHPHPLFGGANTNKVAHTLARSFRDLGFAAIRPNFRGVGQSAGEHDEGNGETEDMLSVITWAQSRWGSMPLALAGFSFGAFVTSHALAALWSQRDVRHAVLVGTAASRFQVAPVPPEAHLRTLVLHGEQDDTVPLADVLDWARPQTLPVTVIPGGGHFFHGQLSLLKNLVVRHLQSAV